MLYRYGWLALLLTACIDGVGPRPRPGTSTTEPPPDDRAAILWWETQPRVVTQGRGDSVLINVAVTGDVSSVQVQPRTGGPVALQRLTATLFSGKVPSNVLLFGYRAGDLHQLAGLIQAGGAGGTAEEFLFVNVKDGTVPAVVVTTIATGAQASPHVLNVRADTPNPGGEVAPAVLRALFDNIGDDFQFVAVIEAVQSDRAPFFTPVRNGIAGIGLTQFDHSGSYGSSARLEGIIHYPDQVDFDLAESDDLHDIGHRWINYLTLPSLAAARPHWPLSSLAAGIMGWTDPATRDWLPFPFDITRQADGTHLLRNADQPRSFNDLDLYLMGLLAPDSVDTHFVFMDQNQRAQVRHNGVLRGAVDSVRIGAVIAREGPRVPAAGVAPRQFRLATIVLSRGGLLGPDEMAFFDYMAARGEQRVALSFSDGVIRGTTLPFYVATGGRGTLLTQLRLAAPQ